MKEAKNGGSSANRPRPTAEKPNVPIRCLVCKIVENTKEDVEFGKDWISCNRCDVWMHEPCAEQFGILDDDDFTCQSCC